MFYSLAQVLRIALFGVVPAHILLGVEEMIFSLLASPSGIKINPLTNVIQFGHLDTSSLYLFNTIMFAFSVAIEVSRKPSQAGSTGSADKVLRKFLFRCSGVLYYVLIKSYQIKDVNIMPSLDFQHH